MMDTNIILLIILFYFTKGVLLQNNDCSDIFYLINDGGQTKGQLVILNPPRVSSIFVELRLQFNVQLYSGYQGEIKLQNSLNNVGNDITNGGSLYYIVTFPVQNVLPKLLSVSVNNARLCDFPIEPAPQYTIITLNFKLSVSYNNYYYQNQQQSYFSPPPKPTYYQDPTSTPIRVPVNVNPTSAVEYQPNQYPQPIQQYHTQLLMTTTTTTIPPPPTTTTTKRPTTTRRMRPTRPPPTIMQAGMSPENYERKRYDDNNCGVPKIFGVISLVVNGNSFQKGEWPWMAAIFRNGIFICGGTLVSTYHVITAAHCIQNKNEFTTSDIRDMYVIVGGHNLRASDSQKRTFTAFLKHQDWNSQSLNYDADIAIAILARPVAYTVYIQPACIFPPVIDKYNIADNYGTVVGWGVTENEMTSEEDPKAINIIVVGDAECLRSHEAYSQITSNRTFCAGNRDGSGPCNGDSGSGLFFKENGKWMLRGIVSASLKGERLQCDVNNYAVFTDVIPFYDWIMSIVG